MDIFKQLKDDYDILLFNEHEGIEAPRSYLTDLMQDDKSAGYYNDLLNKGFLMQYHYVLISFNKLFDRVVKSNLETSDKELFYDMLFFFYHTKLQEPNSVILMRYEIVLKKLNDELSQTENGGSLALAKTKLELMHTLAEAAQTVHKYLDKLRKT